MKPISNPPQDMVTNIHILVLDFDVWPDSVDTVRLPMPPVSASPGLLVRKLSKEMRGHFFHMSNEKKGPWLVGGFVGDEILPRYIGIIS